jgi:tRNA (cytidine/uridine-2'-O-)-methyltransferase
MIAPTQGGRTSTDTPATASSIARLPMFHVVLVTPQIPPNTGNVIRLCANTGCHLHLIEPLGFSMDDKQMRRAGLDYHEYASVRRHPDWDGFLTAEQPARDRMFALTTRGQAQAYSQRFQPGDWLVFGCETEGLSADIRDQFAPERRLRLPMREGQRSLNLSNAVAVLVYEAWRQQGFGATKP